MKPKDAFGVSAYQRTKVDLHAFNLLRKIGSDRSAAGIHIDLGCTCIPFAGRFESELGSEYVGVASIDQDVTHLTAQGLEIHQWAFGSEQEVYSALLSVADKRAVVSFSVLGLLAQLSDIEGALRALNRMAREHAAFVVLSVPNVTQVEIGFKLAFGRWDDTAADLLETKQIRLFDQDRLDRVLRQAGLYTIDTDDVFCIEVDPNASSDHPALARGSQLHAYLGGLRHEASDTGTIKHFVRLCVAGAPTAKSERLCPPVLRPFLSVIVRTQGRRQHTLIEALTALSAQTDTDFEVIIVGHRLSADGLKSVEGACGDTPYWLREKCRVLCVEDGGRARPLNAGFEAAQGRYIAILDDDDIPFGHWVETFRSLDKASPGRMLRAVSVRQDVCNVSIGGNTGLRATGRPIADYAAQFDYLDHLRTNASPNVSIAFPRGPFHDLGMRFDETLTTTEDWDYIMRVAAVVGAASSPKIIAVYRWWENEESSRTLHSDEVWKRNYQRILTKMDRSPVLLPPGSTARLRDLLDSFDRASAPPPPPPPLPPELPAVVRDERLSSLQEITTILNSTSWRATGLVRYFARLVGRPPTSFDDIWYRNKVELDYLARELRQSRSWRLTAPLRRARPHVFPSRRGHVDVVESDPRPAED